MDRRRCWLVAVLCVGTVAAFAPLVASPLVYDDGHAVAENEAIRTLANVPAFFADPAMFSSTGSRMYRPLVLCALALDHALGGGAAFVFKSTNVLMHLAAALLLFRLLERLAVGTRPAFVGAAVFALHPLQTEAVALVSARSEILMAIGVLVAVHGWISLREGRRGGAALLLGTLAALASKESAVVLPVVLAGAEWALPAGSAAAAAKRVAVPAAAVGAWLVLRRLVLDAALPSLPPLSGGGDVLSGSRDLASQLLVQGMLVPKALLLLVWPPALCLDHRIPLGGPDLRLWAGLAALAAAGAACVAAPRRRPLPFVGALLAAGFAAPWVLIPLNVPFAEHRLYLPMVGIALCAAACATRWTEPAFGTDGLTRVAVLACALLAILAFGRSLTFLDDRALWQDVLAKNPASFRAHTGVAQALWRTGDLAGARAAFDRALAEHPRYAPAFEGITQVLVEEGAATGALALLDRAVEMAESTVRSRPVDPFARLSASAARFARGRVNRSAADFRESERLALSCLEIAEPKSLVFRAAAEAREAAGDPDGALAFLAESDRRGLAREPTALARARILAAAGREREAEPILRAVLAANPFAPEAHAQLALLYRRSGRPRDAALHELLGGRAPVQPGAGPNK